MQHVSKAYSESMKSALRNRGYIMISFGLMNQEAMANAAIQDSDTAYFSNKSNVLGARQASTVYATLEENFTKADGSMYFLPRESQGGSYYDTGIISNNPLSVTQYELSINLNIAATDIKGLAINFGDNYPIDFDIIADTGQTVEIRDNTDGDWHTETVLEGITSIKLVFYTMKNSVNRLRIYSILFGYGLVYYNDSVMDSTLESYISPICADVPQIDLSVTLKNYDKYFNVDNPDSAVNFLETGQEMSVSYGYQLPSGEIEWLPGATLLCSEWESDDTSATIRCQDRLRNMDSEYYKGVYNASGTTYYDLVVDVLTDAGITDYYIDPWLKTLSTTNPLPNVTHKEALQIIANACRCVLSIARDGKIQIKSSFVPDMSVAVSGEASYSNHDNILTNDAKDEYASLATNYTQANGAMYFLPKEREATLYTGYISDVISGIDGLFAVNPVITITANAVHSYYSLHLQFGSALPAELVLHTYANGEAVEDYTISADEIDFNCTILRDFAGFDTLEIEFTKTAEPYNRIVLNYFSLSDITNFKMTRDDMTSYPTATKQEMVKDVNVVCYLYQQSSTVELLLSEKVTAVANQTEIYYMNDASYNYSVLWNESSDNVKIVSQGAYYVEVQFLAAGTYTLTINGYRYNVVTKTATKTLNQRGKTVKWENPLICDMDAANALAEWLGEYYSADVEYEYDTRGNPEIDAADIIYQENDFRDDMTVEVYSHTIKFAQSFSGKVTARRVGG